MAGQSSSSRGVDKECGTNRGRAFSQGEEKTNLSFLFLSQSSSSVTRSSLTFGKNKEVQIFHSIRPSDKVLEIESVPIHVASFLGISLVINSIDRQAKQALGDRRRPLCLAVCVFLCDPA